MTYVRYREAPSYGEIDSQQTLRTTIPQSRGGNRNPGTNMRVKRGVEWCLPSGGESPQINNGLEQIIMNERQLTVEGHALYLL